MDGITPQENVALLEAIIAKAMLGPAAAANAMAAYIADRIANDTLRRRSNPPGSYYKARRGEPPAYGTGALSRSIYWAPEPGGAPGGLRASALVGSTDKRAVMFEYGSCLIQPRRERQLHWKDSGGWWSHPWLRVDNEHPFIGPTVEDAIDDGELTRVAIDAFREYDP